jgi:hypothetical protein
MSERRTPATGAIGRTAVAAAAATVLFIGLIVSSAPAGWAQPAEEKLERLAQAEPEGEEAAQVQEDAEGGQRRPGLDVDTFPGGGGAASELVHAPVVDLFPGGMPQRWRTRSPMTLPPPSAAWSTSIR